MNINDYNKVTDRIEPSERCREEIFNRNKRRRNHIKLSKKGITTIIAVAVAACGGTAVFAAEKFGAFDRLKNISERTIITDDGIELPINKFERKDYEKIGKSAETLSEPVTVETENISVNIDSVYCDGRTIVLEITGSLINGNPNNWGYIYLEPSFSINGNNYNYPKNLSEASGYMVLDEDETNSFTGSITFVLNDDVTLNDTTEITVNIEDIQCSEVYFTEKESIGSASIDVSVTPDTELVKKAGITVEDDGYSFTIYEITPVMMTADYSYPKKYSVFNETTMTDIQYDQAGNITQGIPKYSIIAMLYDADGNRLDRVLDSPVDLGNGKQAYTFASPETDTIIVKFCNKQESDENGMPVVMKEITVDLTELKVNE